MATFRLTIECDNAAFQSHEDAEPESHYWALRSEVLRILKHLTDNGELFHESAGKLYDANGNTAGKWSMQ